MKALVSTIISVLCACTARADEIHLMTESYPPYSFHAPDGSVDGASVAQVRAIMDGLHDKVTYTVDIMPWARAIAYAETQPDSCVFLAARTPERENRFAWVTPLLMNANLLVARKDGSVKATSVEEALQVPVGTQREDYTEEILKEKGFVRIDLSATFDNTLAKLLAGRIDLMPMSEEVLHKLVNEGSPIRAIAPLSKQEFGIACNRAMPPDKIADMQASLDRLRTSGEQDRIQARFGLAPVQ